MTIPSNKINIAIDGHSSCGKSTLAKDLARVLGYVYIDSGAMYRAVALYCLENKIALDQPDQIAEALDKIFITMNNEAGSFHILLNGEDVTQRIIQIDVSNIVSEVAAMSIVRRKLVEIQQAQGIQKGVVMDGRDIGTVVLPDAEMKLFITADVDVRTQRRFLELEEKSMDTPYEKVKENLIHRDHIDSTRADSPLIQAADATLIDSSYMSKEEQLFLVTKMAEEKISKSQTS